MSRLSDEQIASREKTLRASVFLSVWAPLTTGIAVLLSRSTTQLADFIRRTIELVALVVSYGVFRYVKRGATPDDAESARLESIAGYFVAAALTISGLVMIVVAIARVGTFEPGGNVYPGLAIATLGLIVNSWFWRRYARLNREQFSAIMAAQSKLYRAKSMVDVAVIVALTSVAIDPTHPATQYIDITGSLAVAFYLLWSGLRAAREARSSAETSLQQCKSHADPA